MARDCCAISSESLIAEEARQGDGASMFEPLAQPHSGEEDQDQSAKDVSGSVSAATTKHQMQTQKKKQEASGPSSTSPGVFISVASSNEPGGSSSTPSGEAAVPQTMAMQIRAMQDMMKKILEIQREEYQWHIKGAAVINEETKRLEEEAEHKKKKEEAKHEKKKKIAQDEVSSVLNLPIMFKHPIHLRTPSDLSMAASSTENTNTVDSNTASSLYELMELVEGKPELLEGDASIQDVLVNSDVCNPEVEVKVVGDARSTQNDEFGSQRELQNAVSENNKLLCSQASDPGIGMAWNFCAISSEFYITEEARQGDGASISEPLAQPHYVEEDQEQCKRCIWVGYCHNHIATTNTQCKVKKTGMEEYASIRSNFPVTRCAQLSRVHQ